MLKNLNTAMLMSLTLTIGAPAHAGIFKWVDATGITHYSDKAPKQHQSQTFDIGKAQAQVSYDLQLTGTKPKKEVMPKMPDLDAIEYDLSETPQKVEQKPINNVKTKLCTNARMQLAAIEEVGHEKYLDEEGNFRLAWGGDEIFKRERRYLTDEQLAKFNKQASFEVEQYCANPYDQQLQDDARASWIRSEYCTVSKAYLKELEHPSKRTADDEINKSIEEVERYCAELKSDEHRSDDRYYPKALRAKHVKPSPKFTIRWH